VELFGRPRPIQLAVGGLDLLRVGHLALLRAEVLGVERRIDKVGRQSRRSLEHRACIVLGPDPEPALRADRPGVQLGHEADDRYAGLVVPCHDRPLDRSRSAPARKQGRVDV
jgi:hypothetical protein